MTEPAAWPSHAIAIVGLAGRFPDARDLDEFWRNVRDGVESLQAFGDDDLEAAGVDASLRADPRYVRKGTFLEGAELFDAGFFGMSPREAQIVDPQQRLFLECAWEAMENAGVVPGDRARSVGVYAGAGMNTYLLTQVLRDPALVESVGGYQLMLGNDKDFLCTRVSYKLDLHGPSLTIQTACSTSLVAVVIASRALQRGECDVALAGGVTVPFPQRAGYLYQEGMILSPDGHCRPFDRSAGGIRPGAGCGIVVLKRLADALADRDTIHAVIRGAAINNDGGDKAGYTAPGVAGQVEVIATAQMLAGVEPRSIGYLEAHGTATPLGDPIEIAALTEVFRASTRDVGFCRLGSLKANLGHLDAAAGVASLIKTVLALENREFPPLVNFASPNPQLDLGSGPFLASAQGGAWAAGDAPRRAGVSSFGIGGTNAHVVIEEAPAVEAGTPVREPQLLVLSARSAKALEEATARLGGHLGKHGEQSLADVAWTLQSARKGFVHRRFVVSGEATHAQACLARPDRAPVHTGRHEGGARRVAFLFSGQGSQHAGMGAGLYAGERVYRDCVDRCAALLRPHLGIDLREAMFAPAGDPAINETRLAQPALFVMEYALAALWAQWGVKPAAMLGHSIGEYVAAHLAGVMSLEDALALVSARGRLMQALPAGRMAAVLAGADEVERRLAGSGVEIAAVNAPGACTISGPAGAMAELLARLVADGIEARVLHTSHAFHSAMMEPVLAPFAGLLAGMRLSAPALPYVSNVTGTWITAEQATSPAYYARHLRETVRFEAGVRAMAAEADLQCLEVGPGAALASLARQCLGGDGAARVVASLGHAGSERPDVPSLLEAAGRLWLAGVPVDWAGLHADGRPRHVPLPTYPFERKRHGVEPAKGHRPAVEPAGDASRSAGASPLCLAPTWTRSEALAGGPARLAGAWLVLGGPVDLADAVAGQLAEAGALAARVKAAGDFAREADASYRARPGVKEDIAAIASDLRRRGEPVAGAIVLWSLVEEGLAPRERLDRLYHAQVALAEGLDATPRTPVRIVVATAGAQSVLDEPVSRTDLALALGPALVLPTEVPGLAMRTIDVAPGLQGHGVADVAGAASALVAEAAAADEEPVVAIRAGRRWLRRFERTSQPVAGPAPGLLKPRGVYLITGGLGGMGLALAHELAARVSARLLLVGRGGLPPRERWDELLAHPGAAGPAAAIRAIRAIESAGGEVLVAAADAADLAAMRQALDQARARWGAIDGVIHAAGVAGAGRLAFLKTRADVDAVLSPKAGGLDVLLQLLRSSPLDFVALMSSINAVAGAPGVADYAAANAVLDAFAESAQRPASWRRVVAIDWGAWREVGMAANLDVPAERREAWQAYLRTGITTAAGVEAFKQALASGLPRVVVVPPEWAGWVEGRRARAATATVDERQAVTRGDRTSASPAAGASPALASPGVEDGPPASPVERQLMAIWTELLGVDSIGLDDDFFALGGHSLAGTRALARIESSLGVRLALRDVFDAPTVRGLAERIAAMAPGRRPDGATGGADDREEIEF